MMRAPFIGRANRHPERGEVLVFLAVGAGMAGVAKRAPVERVLPELWPVAPGVQMVRGNGYAGNPAILARMPGTRDDKALPFGGRRPLALGAYALLPMRIGGRCSAPMLIAARAAAVLTGPPANAIAGPGKPLAAIGAHARHLIRNANILTRHRAEPRRVCRAPRESCPANGAIARGLV